MTSMVAAQPEQVTHPARTDCIAGRMVCTRPVVATWTGMCEHEHFRSGPVCATHRDMSARGRLCCRECLEHPTRPHDHCMLHPVEGLCR